MTNISEFMPPGYASDHFNGTHFFDPDGVPPKSLADLWKWRRNGER